MICVIIPSVWAAMGAACLISLAALKTVPDDLYDAAAIDGAGIWGRMRNVTLPFLKPELKKKLTGTRFLKLMLCSIQKNMQTLKQFTMKL